MHDGAEGTDKARDLLSTLMRELKGEDLQLLLDHVSQTAFQLCHRVLLLISFRRLPVLCKFIRHSPGGSTQIQHITSLAGNETTAQVLSFTIYALSQHNDVQRRLRKEILEFQATLVPGTEPSYDDYLSKMPYLDAVCKEA